jgi:hypothetical protein
MRDGTLTPGPSPIGMGSVKAPLSRLRERGRG